MTDEEIKVFISGLESLAILYDGNYGLPVLLKYGDIPHIEELYKTDYARLKNVIELKYIRLISRIRQQKKLSCYVKKFLSVSQTQGI